MQADAFDVLRALKGFKMAAGASDAEATKWAAANLQKGNAAVQAALDNEPHQDPPSLRRAGFAALHSLAQK